MRNKLIRLLGGCVNLPKDMRGGAVHIRTLTKDWSKEELIEHLVTLAMNSNNKNWFTEYLTIEKELKRIKQILSSTYHTDQSLNHAEHVSNLENKVQTLKKEIRIMQEKAEYFNKVLYATGLIVNCTGCWNGRPSGAEYLTEEKVKTIEHLVLRLRSWFDNHKWRMNNINKDYDNYRKKVKIDTIQDYII